MNIIDNPCTRDCSERSIECHGTCSKYKAFRKYLEEKNHQDRLKSMVCSDAFFCAFDYRQKNSKKK